MTNLVLPYPAADTELGEVLQLDEANTSQLIADAVEAGIREHYHDGNARRDVHVKATGLMRAEFRVNDSISPDLAKGVFIPGKTYQALIRFSNGAGKEQPDSHNDTRGIAIKLLGVPGPKLLETDKDAMTQDFIMVQDPLFFAKTAEVYLSVMRNLNGGLLQQLHIPFDLGLKGTEIYTKINTFKCSNPLQIRYYSSSVYHLGSGPGRKAVKWGIKPQSDLVDPMPKDPGPNYLTDMMSATLKKGPVILKFLVQPKTADHHSVEDLTVSWDESEAPFHEVATITIPSQDFNTPESNKLAETLSYNPWHAIEEHRPMGVVNRMRKVVYERISRVRNTMNAVERKEPVA
jgi:Catalase